MDTDRGAIFAATTEWLSAATADKLGIPADAGNSRVIALFGLSGKFVQEFIQRVAAGLLGRPVRAIAGVGKLHAHGLLSALDLPFKGIRAAAAPAHDDKISPASIVGMHTQSD
jgi:hypothetical protein